jgi:vWA-MoxR associated protein C-terminal domain/Effector-associated domain 2/vWA-MoxR associated protein middle region 0
VGLTARRLSVAELDSLCSAFLKLPGMRDSSTRNLYIDALDRQLANSLTVQRFLDPHHDVWALLQACQEHADGIRQLAVIVRAFHRGLRAMTELDELIECMFPDEFLDHVEREWLLTLLADVEPEYVRLACRSASPPSWLAASAAWTEMATVVQRFESCIGTPNGPAPLLVFVDFVAHQVDAARSAELHRWIDKVGIRENPDRNRLRDLCITTAARLNDEQHFYFIVQLRPDGVEPDEYLMSVCLQHHHTVEEPLHRDDEPLTLPEVVEQLPDLLHRAHEALGVETGEMVLEFILPRGLIGHPVDQWQVDHVFPHRLGTSYPVVVRSLDRLSRRELHSSWRHKWRWLNANGHRDEPDAVCWVLGPNVRAPSALHASLRREESSVAMAMAFPPEENDELMQDELTAALYAGLPVILWCRDNSLRHQFERETKEMLTGRGLTELPKLVQRLRQQADADEGEEAAIGRHLTLLWDDADRVPESFRSVRLQAPQ